MVVVVIAVCDVTSDEVDKAVVSFAVDVDWEVTVVVVVVVVNVDVDNVVVAA